MIDEVTGTVAAACVAGSRAEMEDEVTTMADERDLVRQQSFDCDGPVDIDIELGNGSVEI